MGARKQISQEKIEKVLYYRSRGYTYRRIKKRLPSLSLYMIQKIIKTAQILEEPIVDDFNFDI